MELNEILAAINSLAEEDKQKVKDILDQQGETPPADAETAGENQGQATENIPVEGQEESQETSVGIEEEKDNEEVTDEPIPDMASSATSGENQETAAPMQEEVQPPPLQDEQGGDMPIDYQQIIDGLNAKAMALETENKQLKAKLEGAFGLTSKPGAFTPVNNLYGDTTDIPPMRK